MKSCFVGNLMIFLSLLSANVYSHGLRIAVLDIAESAPLIYQISYRYSGIKPVMELPLLPEDCQPTNLRSFSQIQSGSQQHSTLQCKQTLAGRTLRIPNMATQQMQYFLNWSWLDGSQGFKELNEVLGEQMIRLPTSAKTEPAIILSLANYFPLGVEHILTGFDHLLFLVCLIILIPRTSIIYAITAFTLGHSISLGLAAFNVLTIPSAPVELLIALTILYLAVDIIHMKKVHLKKESINHSYPLIVFFGLIHGLGFAAVLSEIGFPSEQRWWALLLFNLGIELGQLLFVIVFILVLALMVDVLVRSYGLRQQSSFLTEKYFRRWNHLIAAYSIGSIAAFWLINRIIMI